MVTDQPSEPGSRLRWVAIVIFVACPWALGLVHLAIRPPPMASEPVLKATVLEPRRDIDTVIVGDSRVGRVGGAPFTDHGLHYFNMALSGMSPEDAALQLYYALERQPIRHAVIGVSFENMAQRRPFEHARYHRESPFRTLPLADITGSVPPQEAASATTRFRQSLQTLLPVASAGETYRYYRLLRRRGAPPALFRDDGTYAYALIEEEIRDGTYDYPHHMNPKGYFFRNDGEASYLETRQLSPVAKATYEKIFTLLQARRIQTVVYETVKTQKYQSMIDADPLLRGLELEWRAFYRAAATSCIRFVDRDAQRHVYDEKDFFDSTHYLGGNTEARVNEMLVRELTTLDAACGSTQPSHPKGE